MIRAFVYLFNNTELDGAAKYFFCVVMSTELPIIVIKVIFIT